MSEGGPAATEARRTGAAAATRPRVAVRSARAMEAEVEEVARMVGQGGGEWGVGE